MYWRFPSVAVLPSLAAGKTDTIPGKAMTEVEKILHECHKYCFGPEGRITIIVRGLVPWPKPKVWLSVIGAILVSIGTIVTLAAAGAARFTTLETKTLNLITETTDMKTAQIAEDQKIEALRQDLNDAVIKNNDKLDQLILLARRHDR